MSHTYDFAKFEAVIERIDALYLPILNALYLQFLSEINETLLLMVNNSVRILLLRYYWIWTLLIFLIKSIFRITMT